MCHVLQSDFQGGPQYYGLFYQYHGICPTFNASCPGTIHAGDILLYGNNCVVVFYKTFSTSYTQIGRITNPSGLEAAVGSGGVSASLDIE